MIQEINNSILQLQQSAQSLLSRLNDAILSLPDNPNIERVSSNAFTMSSANFSKGLILTPAHYDFRYQYKCIVEALSTCRMENIVKTFEKIISEQCVGKVRLHVDVINNLKTLL